MKNKWSFLYAVAATPKSSEIQKAASELPQIDAHTLKEVSIKMSETLTAIGKQFDVAIAQFNFFELYTMAKSGFVYVTDFLSHL